MVKNGGPRYGYNTGERCGAVSLRAEGLGGLPLALYRLAELVLLVLIFAHFKIVHYFRQQFKYRSSFGFACRRIAQSAVEHDVFLVQQKPVHFLLPNFLDWQQLD
jgi:hypothetical protein